MSATKVLIVEDEDETRKELQKFLDKRLECEITEVADGSAALAHLKEQQVDVLLVDISMPGISGMEVINEAKSLFSNILILVLTKWDSPEIADQIRSVGAHYMPKPFSLKVILQTIEDHLA